MLFTYGNCKCCKNESANVKVLLNNIFPAGICDMICDYNTHCFKCNNLIFKENEYIKEENPSKRIPHYLKHTEPLTTTGRQIHFFQTEMPSPIFLSNTNKTNVRRMRREIDVLMDTLALKMEFQHNKLKLQAIKSYVKKNWKYTYHILKNFNDLEFMTYNRKIQVWWLPENGAIYDFRHRGYIVKDILEIFLREYLKELFRYYEHYINETEIEEHLQKVIKT